MRGGSRPGSGRPSAFPGQTTKRIRLALPERTLERLEALAGENETTKAAVVAIAIDIMADHY